MVAKVTSERDLQIDFTHDCVQGLAVAPTDDWDALLDQQRRTDALRGLIKAAFLRTKTLRDYL
jgi:hypothetical protein